MISDHYYQPPGIDRGLRLHRADPGAANGEAHGRRVRRGHQRRHHVTGGTECPWMVGVYGWLVVGEYG